MMAERGNLRRVATPGARRWSPESSTAGLEDETTTSQATAIERLRSEMATVSKQQEEVLAALKRTRGPFRRMLYFLYGTDAATEQRELENKLKWLRIKEGQLREEKLLVLLKDVARRYSIRLPVLSATFSPGAGDTVGRDKEQASSPTHSNTADVFAKTSLRPSKSAAALGVSAPSSKAPGVSSAARSKSPFFRRSSSSRPGLDEQAGGSAGAHGASYALRLPSCQIRRLTGNIPPRSRVSPYDPPPRAKEKRSFRRSSSVSVSPCPSSLTPRRPADVTRAGSQTEASGTSNKRVHPRGRGTSTRSRLARSLSAGMAQRGHASTPGRSGRTKVTGPKWRRSVVSSAEVSVGKGREATAVETKSKAPGGLCLPVHQLFNSQGAQVDERAHAAFNLSVSTEAAAGPEAVGLASACPPDRSPTSDVATWASTCTSPQTQTGLAVFDGREGVDGQETCQPREGMSGDIVEPGTYLDSFPASPRRHPEFGRKVSDVSSSGWTTVESEERPRTVTASGLQNQDPSPQFSCDGGTGEVAVADEGPSPPRARGKAEAGISAARSTLLPAVASEAVAAVVKQTRAADPPKRAPTVDLSGNTFENMHTLLAACFGLVDASDPSQRLPTAKRARLAYLAAAATEQGAPGARAVETETPPPVWVTHYKESSQKHGLGYAMSNGSFGVTFKDGTKMILEPKGTAFEYVGGGRRGARIVEGKGGDSLHVEGSGSGFRERRHEPPCGRYALDEFPSDFREKVNILRKSREQLLGPVMERDSAVAGATASPTNSARPHPTATGEGGREHKTEPGHAYAGSGDPLVFVDEWSHKQSSWLFRLSDQTVQVLFLDETQIWLSEGARLVTFVAKDGKRETLRLVRALEEQRAGIKARVRVCDALISQLLERENDTH